MPKRPQQLLLFVILVAGLTDCTVHQSDGDKARRGGSSPSPMRPGAVAPEVIQEKTAAKRRIVQAIERMERLQLGAWAVSRADGLLLRTLVRSVGAKRVVEIGTSTGYSSLWLLLGLAETGGKLTTYEYDKGRAADARDNFRRAGVGERVQLIEGDAHQEVGKLKGTIDLLFLDADKKGYIDYLQKLLPLVRKGGLIVAHNMVYPTPDPRYIKAITTNPSLSTLFLNMDGAGMGVTQKKK